METSSDRGALIPAERVFCRWRAGDLPASFVYRDEVCSAFMDAQPVNAGHVLGYGGQGAGGEIPPNDMLTFEVELLDGRGRS